MTIQEHYSYRKTRKRTRPLQVRFVDTVKIHALPLGVVVPKEELFYSPQNIQAFQLERFEEEAQALEAERQKAKQARKSLKQEAKRQRRERLQARRKKRAQRSHNKNAKNASSDEDLYESDANHTHSHSEAATSATCSSSGSSSETEGEAGAVVVQPQHVPLVLQPTWHHHHKHKHTSPGGRKSPSKRNSPGRKALRMRRQSQTTQILASSGHLDIPMLHHDDHPTHDDTLCELDPTALKYAPDEEEGVALLDSSTATTMAGSPAKSATRLGSSRMILLSWNQEGWKWSTVALFVLLMGSWVWFSFHMGRW